MGVVRTENLARIYGQGEDRVEALAGVSLMAGRGEWVAVVGSSRSGKSTPMNMLGLLDRPAYGSYVLNGRGVSGLEGGAARGGRGRGPCGPVSPQDSSE